MTFLSPGDPDYAKAKRIRQGTETLPEVLAGFVDAFEEKYGVRPLSVDTDTIRTNTPWTPRLSVVLERSAEAHLFKKDMFAFDRTKQVGTARLFLRAVPERRLRRLFGLPLFGQRVEIMIGIDAKETLDRDYQGNLYYYFK